MDRILGHDRRTKTLDMNSEELFQASGLSGVIDTAIPQSVFDRISDVLGFNPLGHFVWWYPAREDTEEYKKCGGGGMLLSVARLYYLTEDRRKLIDCEEMTALCKTLKGRVDTDIVVNLHLEGLKMDEAARKRLTYKDKLEAKQRREWNENCKRDGIDPSVSFACFSKDNV